MMSTLFDILFETLLAHRIGRWLLVVLIAGMASWFGGIRNSSTWIVIAVAAGVALAFEVFDRFSSRKEKKGGVDEKGEKG